MSAPNLPFMTAALLIAAALAAWYDLRTRIIPDWLTIPLILAGIAVSVAERGAWITGGTLLLGGALCELLARRNILGGGDLKLLLGLTLFVGPLSGLAIFYWSLICSLPLFAIYMVRYRTFRPSVPYAVAILAAVFLLHWRGYLVLPPQ